MCVAPAAAVAFVVLTMLVAGRQAALVTADAAVSTAAYGFTVHHPGWRAMAGLVTHLGDLGLVLVAAVGATVWLLWRRRWSSLALIVTALLASGLLSRGVRTLTARPRPVDRLWPVDGYAFPSGHATNSATAALILAFVCWPLLARPGRAALVALAVCWPLVVGATRVVLVVHWPSDVLGGWLVAVTTVPAAAVLVHLAARRRPTG